MFNSAAVAVTPSKILSSAAVAVTPSRILSSAPVAVSAVAPSVNVPDTVKPATVVVPVNVGDALFALEFTAVCTAVNSVSNSLPRIIFPLSPGGSASLEVKLVLFV
jgi:hypothetical protein